MSHPPYPHPQAPGPDRDRPDWYSTPPQDERRSTPSAAPTPDHALHPGYHPDPPRAAGQPPFPASPVQPVQSAAKPYSPGLAGLGWVLTTLFGLAFVVFFFAGVSAFNTTADGANGARTLGAFIGFAVVLLLPAIPVFIGIRLIRQPRRIRPR